MTDCALLAGLISSPYRYNPFRNAQAAKERRDFVLKRMHDEGVITAQELNKALIKPIELRRAKPIQGEKRDHDYFIAEFNKRHIAPDFFHAAQVDDANRVLCEERNAHIFFS